MNELMKQKKKEKKSLNKLLNKYYFKKICFVCISPMSKLVLCGYNF